MVTSGHKLFRGQDACLLELGFLRKEKGMINGDLLNVRALLTLSTGVRNSATPRAVPFTELITLCIMWTHVQEQLTFWYSFVLLSRKVGRSTLEHNNATAKEQGTIKFRLTVPGLLPFYLHVSGNRLVFVKLCKSGTTSWRLNLVIGYLLWQLSRAKEDALYETSPGYSEQISSPVTVT